MKKAASVSWLTDRCNPWLTWWQELLINWVASWPTVGAVVIISASGDEQCEWKLPSDLDLKRLELEELLDRQHKAES